MRKLSYFFSIAVLAGMVAISGCKKDDPEPTEVNPDAPVVTSIMNANNGGNTGTANASLNVTTATGSAVIRLEVSTGVNLSKIYIMKSEDNGLLTPLSFSSITNADGKTFTGGSSDYSFDIPSSTKNFVLDIPVPVRSSSSAVSDVYTIWITSGNGGFLKPTKNRELGPAVVTLKYTAAAVVPFATATVNVGTQSALYSSFLVTSGQVSALTTLDYQDAPGSADIRFVTLNSSGKKDNTSSNVYMYSPNNVTAANPSGDASADFVVTAGSRTTKFAAYAGSADFASITGAQIDAISSPSLTNIQVSAGSVYVFETESGKKGVVKINTLTADTDASAAGGYNANVTVKVLN